ncbi:MAG: sugar nucleotide-binding protein [Inhella sp.]|uniref:sugar nucleotide-binding protein n=1 Tax=Inhella sp. TaxID=1921806 RepID=UPI0022C08CCA|nr:sugar nucleotide-binding protein [Inhella sp.]MCZ8236126.1 sugar nucleotide-binding protein [Inhella sp.]
MRLLITGLSGTLAPVLASAARARGHRVLGLDHRLLRSLGPTAAARYLDAQLPDAVAHLAMANAQASGELAAWAARRRLPFVMTSTAMVFHHEPDGPHAVGDARNAVDDYGRGKAATEDAVVAAHPSASIVRIGWQIDPEATGNNMLRALDGWQAEQGEVAASTAWIPACSYMADTARALLRLVDQPGVHHVDSNADEGWTFAELVARLARAHQRSAWRVRPHDGYRHDQRLAGGGRWVPPLSAVLGPR